MIVRHNIDGRNRLLQPIYSSILDVKWDAQDASPSAVHPKS